MTIPPVETQPSEDGCGVIRPGDAPAPSAAPVRSAWKAVLMAEGLNDDGVYKPPQVVKRAAALFVGAPVRAAHSLSWPHGRQEKTDRPIAVSGATAVSSANADYVMARLMRMVGPARMRLILAADAELAEMANADPALLAPRPIGHVRSASYEPSVGVVGALEFDDAPVDGPLLWTGLIRGRESLPAALERAWRDGYSDLLRLSVVCSVGDLQSVVKEITAVIAIDLVLFASSDARLLEPIRKRRDHMTAAATANANA